LPADGEDVLVAVRQELAVVRELALDEPRGERERAGPERDLALVDDDLDLSLLVRGRGPARLRQGALRNQRGGFALRGGRELAQRQPVRVGGDERHALAVHLEEDPGERG